MFRLYCPITKGLDPVSNMFKQHITSEGMALIQQAEDAAASKQGSSSSAAGGHEHLLMKKIMELHDKYMVYVSDCFENHTLFHKALKEAFVVFCNKSVAGCSSAELLATFCDNILKKGGGSEKLSDEAIEDTLEKVVKLLLLHSLSCAKYKILLKDKDPNTKNISKSDFFEFNSKFTDRMRRIKIPLPPSDERKKVVEDVDKDRNAKCVEMLSRMFKPDIRAIKKRIEDLITRDYLERENPNVFKYLA
ncbi:hypothetical protein COLO4_29352 [Corchorus olitorius]|uniref:Cullin neddylation domain-containing protein n=1 Tax=Corchorus olitorius TaxID=93759 RepID=A0A1R3HF28_9ROSI|nr:hypothetical protein COLO4_29352 [Corchorus olitorius]